MGKTNNDGAVSLLARDDPLVTAAERVPLAWPRNARRAESGHGHATGLPITDAIADLLSKGTP